MSRTRVKRPIYSPVCYFSNKKAKRFANRKYRRRVNRNFDDTPPMNEVTNTWDFPSDGLPTYDPEYTVDGIKKDLIAALQSFANGLNVRGTWEYYHVNEYSEWLQKNKLCKEITVDNALSDEVLCHVEKWAKEEHRKMFSK